MRIVEAGHHKMSVQIDHLRLRTLHGHHTRFSADRNQSISDDGHRLSPLHRMKRRITYYAGVNVRVNINGICDRARRRLCHYAGSENIRCKKEAG